MEKRRVLVSTVYLKPGDEVGCKLREAGFEPIYSPFTERRTEDELIELLRGVDGAIAAGDPFTARVLASAPQLRVISRTGVGYDAIDVEAATARGVVVTTTPGVNSQAVADWTFALILCCARKLSENLAEAHRGGSVAHVGVDLAGRIIGIIGLGTIGKEVARRAQAFRMRILACSPSHDVSFAKEYEVTYVTLDTLLCQSDFVSLHCSLTKGTEHLINAERLALMKPTSVLINTARGGLVDTAALCDALARDQIAGAGLDVVENEPLPAKSPLQKITNVYLSPHVGGSTTDARRLSGALAAENLIHVLNGRQPRCTVNPAVFAVTKAAPTDITPRS